MYCVSLFIAIIAIHSYDSCVAFAIFSKGGGLGPGGGDRQLAGEVLEQRSRRIRWVLTSDV